MTDTHVKLPSSQVLQGGIGRAVSLRLAGDGFAVVVNYAGNEAKADEVVTEIKTAGGTPLSPFRPMWRTPPTSSAFSGTRSEPSAGSMSW